MDEANRNSTKLDIEAARLQSVATEKTKQELEPKESYKKLSESELDQANAVIPEPDASGATMVRENGNYKDGEDERMLNGNGAGDAATDKDKLAQKEVEVKFISEQNGDARIDLEVERQQTFSGMTKEELMKFANDPFWIRLRWFLFVLFWGLWIAMLAGAIYIIMDAPKCAAPVALKWWQEGPLVQIDERDYKNQAETVKRYGAKGVIYELSADETYLVNTASVENKIKELVGTFNVNDIKVILDLTPNFVTKDDQLFKDALASPGSPSRSAFVWKESGSTPTNWLAVTGGGSAWKEVASQQFVLAQFGADRIDLQLNDPIAKDKLKTTLRHLVQLGVRGFRLANAKHFIVDRDGKNDVNAEVEDKTLSHTDYGFWTHAHTTYQDGLGALLHELTMDVKNATSGEGFLSVSEDITRPEVFSVGGKLGVDLPEFGNVESVLRQPLGSESAKLIRDDIRKTFGEINKYASAESGKPWIQWPYDKSSMSQIAASEYNVFMFLLPGVPVVPLDVLTAGNGSLVLMEHLEKYRASPSYQHGTFAIYNDANATSVGYTRQKSGNPGYFVALNLAEQQVEADFSQVVGIADELTVVLSSENYRVPDIAVKSKVPSNAVPLSGRSALITTYVPKQG
ncbi:neutral and basic amino acid transport protein rBAT [Topomyia yanbarensis]|uniref:neutral and basic amino acid transport protein rBAT n=1 Tax=Topomyia yanbarensis TaxID=2498891 RepID=UPI00273ABACE|nr:neutral and basic amino acid transport protein rBAT [Topomyia yanbarensis]XP_058820836.1 neutral and basic amino acid transport protein rBAT [Topomyia yanbarensis]